MPLANVVEGATGRGTYRLWSYGNSLRGAHQTLGLYENIRSAYSFICHNYASNLDDIILIGFSRGAFTVRCVAQFINDVGLLTKDGLIHLLALFKAWKKNMEANSKSGSPSQSIFELAGLDSSEVLECQGLLHTQVRIKACAVWETVSSIGLPTPGCLTQPTPRKFKLVNSELCPNIENAFQALSLHEHRRPLRPIPWKLPENSNQILKQCWFLGDHSGVGGGSRAEALAHLTLVWMMAQLKDHLSFKSDSL